MSSITPSELDERLSRDDVFVLDIRPEANYRGGHIDDSYSAPVYDDLRTGDTEALDSHVDAIPADAKVVTVCKAGVVARRATTHLQAQGYDASTLVGGFTGWRQYDGNTIPYRLVSFVRRILP